MDSTSQITIRYNPAPNVDYVLLYGTDVEHIDIPLATNRTAAGASQFAESLPSVPSPLFFRLRQQVSPGGGRTALAGVVVDPTGTPVSGATISVFSLEASVQTGVDGRFLLGELPTDLGPLTLTAEHFSGGRRLVANLENPNRVGNETTDLGRIMTREVPDRVSERLAIGNNHWLGLRRDGSLWAWGDNNRGQLGNGTQTPSSDPVRIGSGAWRSVSAGGDQSAGIRDDGTLWRWGRIDSGRNDLAPRQLGVDPDWESVSVGEYHTLAIKRDGSLWAWGDNRVGQLGDGTTQSRTNPVPVSESFKWIFVDAGSGKTIAIRSDRTLWVWGNTGLGDFGSPKRQSSVPIPIPIEDGSGGAWISASAGKSPVQDSFVAVRADGTLWTWGENAYGQLGDGSTAKARFVPAPVAGDTKWVEARSGDRHTLGLAHDGTLWACGNNDGGQLGNGVTGSGTNRFARVESSASWHGIAAGLGRSLALRADGTLWAAGTNVANRFWAFPNPVPLKGLAIWESFAAGFGHTLGIRSDGSLWACGSNEQGQLGLGMADKGRRLSPVQIARGRMWRLTAAGWGHSLALGQDGTLWGWGDDSRGQIAREGSSVAEPTRIGTNHWTWIAAGEFHSVGIMDDGSLWAWGANDAGQLGIGSRTQSYRPMRIGNETSWRVVAAGQSHCVALKMDGSLWGWGWNEYGQVGDRTSTSRLRPVRVGTATDWTAIAAGAHHTSGLRTGNWWLWGTVAGSEVAGAATQPGPRQVGTESTYRSVTGAGANAFAVRDDGSAWGKGIDASGILLGAPKPSNDVPAPPVGLTGGVRWKHLFGGFSHVLAIREDGMALAWGDNHTGKLGAGSLVPLPGGTAWSIPLRR